MRSIYLLTIICTLPLLLNAQSIKEQDSIHILTYNRVFSESYEGWKISYTGFKDNSKDFIIPLTISFDAYKVKPKIYKDKKITSLDTYALGYGFDGYQKILEGTYLNLGANIPVGLEIIRDLNRKRTNHFLIGINPKVGLKLIPSKEFGLVVGGNIFWRFSNSKILDNEKGFEIEVGINF